MKTILQHTAFVVACLAILAFILSGCGMLRPPTVYAGQYFDMQKDSKPIVQVGTNGSQANAIHAPIGDAAGTAPGEKAEADKGEQMAKSAGLFVNNTVGDRSADVDATTALEMLKDVQGTSAGQAQTTTKGDSSPATGDQTQTPSNTQTQNKTTNTPVAVSQQGAVAQTAATPEATGQAIPAVFSLGIPQAKTTVTAAQKSAIDATVAADTDTAVPAGLDMTLAEWRILKAAYIECPSCLSLNEAERAALQAATGK